MYCTALLYCTALHTPLYFSASLLYCQCSLTHSIIPFSPSPLLHTYPHTVRAAAAASRERPCHVFAPAGVGTTGIDCSVLLLYFTLLYLAYALPIHHLYLTYTLPTPYLCSTPVPQSQVLARPLLFVRLARGQTRRCVAGVSDCRRPLILFHLAFH
jgi:hypothetical protein